MSALPPHFTNMIPAMRSEPEKTEILDLSHLAGILWRRKLRLIFTAVITASFGALWATYLTTPYYQATTVLMLSEPEETLPSLGAVMPGFSSGNSAANTEVEILQSRSLFGEVIDELNLVQDPEFKPIPFWKLPDIIKQSLPNKFQFPETEFSTGQSRTLTIDKFSKAVSVHNIPDSSIFEVLAESVDPTKAARIVNTLAEKYIQRQINEKTAAHERVVQWLSAQVGQLQEQLEMAETELAKFTASMELITPETHASLALRLKELRLKITTYKSSETQRNTVRLRNQLKELSTLEKELTLMHERQSHDLLRLQQLEREVQAAQIIHAEFLGRFKESVAQMDVNQPDSQIVSMAETPVIPVRPKPALVILMAGVLGFVLMAIQVLRRNSANKTIFSQTELEDATGYTVLGQTTLLSNKSQAKMLQTIKQSSSHGDWGNTRMLRSMINAGDGKRSQIILITSAMPNDGRTVLTLSLAHSIAQMGKKVLVVEGDLHRKGMQKMMKTNSRGIYAVLRQNLTLQEAICPCDTLGIDVLKGTVENMDPADMFCLTSFRCLLRSAKETYDYIIIDSPPVLAVPDAGIIGEHADAILFAAKWGKSSIQEINEGLQALKKSGLKVTGLALLQVNLKKQRHNIPKHHLELQEYHKTRL